MKYNTTQTSLRPTRLADAANISAPFFMSPDRAGADGFLAAIAEPAIRGYIISPDCHYVVAGDGGQLVGVVALRGHDHLYHLFVAPAYQGQGRTRQLWQHVKAHALRHGNPGRFTVNASLNAVPVYQLLGFVATQHGIRYQPMVVLDSPT